MNGNTHEVKVASETITFGKMGPVKHLFQSDSDFSFSGKKQ